jgi:hypothetical protein
MNDREQYAPGPARGAQVRKHMFKRFAGVRSLYD